MEMSAISRPDLKRASIESVLKVAGADMWTEEAIKAHKASELAKAPPKSRLLEWQSTIQEAAGIIGLIAQAAFCIGLIGAFVLGLLSVVGLSSSWALGAVYVFLGSLVVLFAIDRIVNTRVRGPAKWEKTLSCEDMPARAKQIMRDIRALHPDSSFVLHELRQDTVKLDPILEACFYRGKGVTESRYVLVWDKDGAIVSPPQ